MNIQIHYFTGTGNTKYIANLFAKSFLQYGYTIDDKSMEEGFFLKGEAEYLIIGFPKFYGYIPLFYMNFLKENLPQVKQQCKPKVILFCTQAATTKTSFEKLIEMFDIHGYEVVWAETFALGNNYMIKERSKETSQEDLEARIKQAQQRVPIIIDKILSGVTFLEEADPDRALKAVQGATQISRTAHQLMEPFAITDVCTNCMDCIKFCPTGSILKQNNQFIFTSTCIMCVRCVNICPVNAFTYDGVQARQYLPMINEIKNLRIFCRE